MIFVAVTKRLKVCIAAVILNYSIKRVKSKLVCYAECENNRLQATGFSCKQSKNGY